MVWVTYKYLGFDATHVRLFTFNSTYAFYVAYSCHTYTIAVGSLIYPMSGFNISLLLLFHNPCKMQQTKKSRRVSTPACQLAAAYVRPVAHMYTQCISVALQCAYATCAQQMHSDYRMLSILLTMEGAEALSDNPLSRIHHVCTIVNPRGWILRFTNNTESLGIHRAFKQLQKLARRSMGRCFLALERNVSIPLSGI